MKIDKKGEIRCLVPCEIISFPIVCKFSGYFSLGIPIANIFVITKSVIATSMVSILIGLSAFMASFLVPLVTKIIPLNRVLFLTQGGKTALVAILVALFTKFQFLPAVGMYVFVIAISILDGFAAPVSYAMIPRYAYKFGKANAALSMSGEGVQLIGWGLGDSFTLWLVYFLQCC